MTLTTGAMLTVIGIGIGCQSTESLQKYPTTKIKGKTYRIIPVEDILLRETIPAPPAPREKGVAIIINTRHQRAWLYQNGQLTATSVTCTGRQGFTTPTGTFKVIAKHRDWISTIYHVPMPFFLRLNVANGKIGIHQGGIAINPASHGCIRLPESYAHIFFGATPIGSPVIIENTPRNLNALNQGR